MLILWVAVTTAANLFAQAPPPYAWDLPAGFPRPLPGRGTRQPQQEPRGPRGHADGRPEERSRHLFECLVPIRGFLALKVIEPPHVVLSTGSTIEHRAGTRYWSRDSKR